MPGLGQIFQDLVGVIDRRRHQLRRLAAGVAEHDALVAGSFVLVADGIDALRDVGRLSVQQNFDIGVLPMEAVLLVADLVNCFAGGFLYLLRRDFRPPNLTGDNHPIGGRQRLACDADLVGIEFRFFGFAEEEINHLVGDAIANLVGMAFRNRLAGEQIRGTRQEVPPGLKTGRADWKGGWLCSQLFGTG